MKFVFLKIIRTVRVKEVHLRKDIYNQISEMTFSNAEGWSFGSSIASSLKYTFFGVSQQGKGCHFTAELGKNKS